MGYDQQVLFCLNKEINLGNYLKDKPDQIFKLIQPFV